MNATLQDRALPFIRAQRAGCHSLGAYAAIMAKEFAAMLPYLPAKCEAWADIGCGVGGLSAELTIHYPYAAGLLIDREEMASPIRYGYKASPEYYNSLALAAAMVPGAKTHSADGTIPVPNFSLDVIVSTLAWCFHFPYATYRRETLRTLRPGGTMVIDLRNGADHSPLLEDFRIVHEIEATAKYRRLVLCGA